MHWDLELGVWTLQGRAGSRLVLPLISRTPQDGIVSEGKGQRTMVVMATILLALTFIWRLMPADEVPSPTLNALSILVELAMLIGVVGMVPRILRSLPEGAPRGGWIFLLVVAIVSGLGIFGIRLSGGPRVELPPRTSSTSTADGGLPHQMHEQLVAMERLIKKIAATGWFQTFVTQDPVKIRTLTRQDLQEERALCLEMRECADRILKVFAEASAKGVAHSTLSDEPGATRRETWQATRDLCSATYDYLGLIEQHWDEWIANPIPAVGANLQPWQLEIQRLMAVARIASLKVQAILHPSTTSGTFGIDSAALAKQAHDVFSLWDALNEKALALPWLNDSAHRRTLPRRDLQDARQTFQDMLDCAERALKILAEAESKKIDLSKTLDSPLLSRPEFWRASQRAFGASYEKMAVIEQHWDEFVAQPFPESASDLKPWQRDVRRLGEVAAAATKEVKALVNSAAKPSPAVASPPGNNFDQLALQTHMLPAVADYVTASKRLKESRWIKSPDANAYHPQKITRADLHDANEKLRDLIAAIDKLRTDLDAVTVPVPATEKEYWRVKRETSIAFQQLTTLLEENWKEWHVSGIQPKTGETKPWQKEAIRLQSEIDKLKQNEQTSILL